MMPPSALILLIAEREANFRVSYTQYMLSPLDMLGSLTPDLSRQPVLCMQQDNSLPAEL